MQTLQGYYLNQATFKLMLAGLLCLTMLFDMQNLVKPLQAQRGSSLRFYGSGATDHDRVKIPLGLIDSSGRLTTSYPVNVSSTFTIEFWMKATATNNPAPACPGGWYTGNILIDRDVFGAGDYGDYGVAICNQRLAVGVSVGSDDRLLTGTTIVTDGQWHHIAITRAENGQVRLFVDGQPDRVLAGPVGRIDYRLNRTTAYPASDPFLVLGAEKHDYPGSRYYNGLLDDLHLSRVVRYTDAFLRPTAPHPVDADTVAFYRFDEGAGTVITDSAPGGISTGELKPRDGDPTQHWSTDTPFGGEITPTATSTPAPTATRTPTDTSTPAPTATRTPTDTSTPALTATTTPMNTATTTSVSTVTTTPTTTLTTVSAPPEDDQEIRIYIPLISCSHSVQASSIQE
ncbi:LamG domain-containing protein [Chloroflexus sp.]|uniref:LamG domain-containing protein n=1 Tax=Chloroflexus sp. TaxID=1904827 RepID=UPI002ACE5588|nr:LamG-like jellyroll fold domain-containing protein [Chloroflexus sp.]